MASRRALRFSALAFADLELGGGDDAVMIGIDAVEQPAARREGLVGTDDAVMVGVEPIEDRLAEEAELVGMGKRAAQQDEGQGGGSRQQGDGSVSGR